MNADALIDAYHAVYDVKDEHLDDDAIRVTAYDALAQIEKLMDRVGVSVPKRYDGRGRQA